MTHNPQVVGSTPTAVTKFISNFEIRADPIRAHRATFPLREKYLEAFAENVHWPVNLENRLAGLSSKPRRKVRNSSAPAEGGSSSSLVDFRD
ncbi:MAG TPA: hypothetical protein VMI10_20370 [Terriglobales bacterium]|nr:hypothetical protein [Terriglobales bacterium]